MLASKRGVCLPKLVLVPKHRQPGVQLDLATQNNSTESERGLCEKNYVSCKIEIVPANYVLQMYDDEDDSDSNVCASYTRYQIYYCSEE